MNSSKRPSMSIGLAVFKFKKQTRITALERSKKHRQEQFGMEYLKLLTKTNSSRRRSTAAINANKSTKEEVNACLQKAIHDVHEINTMIQTCYEDIENHERTEQEENAAEKQNVKSKKKGNDAATMDPNEDSATAADAATTSGQPPGQPGGRGGRGGRGRGRGRESGRGRASADGRAPTGRGQGGRGGPGRGRSQGGRGGRGRGRGRGREGHIPPMSPGPKGKPLGDPDQRLPKRVDRREAFQPRHSPEGKRARLSAVNLALVPEEFKPGSSLHKWTHSEWKFREYTTNGGWTKTTEGLVEKLSHKSISRGIQKFKKHPELFIAMMYPTPMLEWPENEQEYTLIYREGTTGLRPKGVSPRGQVKFLMHEYQPLPSFPNDELPINFRDEYTDKMTYRKQKLVTKKLPAYLPGRGTGLMDDPRLKIIGEIDPSDIAQGQVGNCWLLSGIASLAEFNGAIHRLFRHTDNLDQMPFVDGRPNMYTVTLWDLTTWQEVDVVVDERLPARKDMKGALFGAKTSQDGELWVCYLEKAIAAHCGGWDKIDGGQCTHAWSLLTGCKDQYIIQRVPEHPETGPFGMWAKYDPDAEEWAPHGNSPSDGHQGVWRVPWPELGGGGVDDLDEDDLFLRLCAWSDQNYLIGASSKGDSDRNSTNGVVDNHAYSVIDCRHDVAGTGIDLIQVRNPWGHGGIENGRFARKGNGWDQHPEIKKTLKYKELEEDDGVFWVTKEEFFVHYRAIYVGAMNMKTFLGIEEVEGVGASRNSQVADHSLGVLPSPPLFDDSDGEAEEKIGSEKSDESSKSQDDDDNNSEEEVSLDDGGSEVSEVEEEDDNSVEEAQDDEDDDNEDDDDSGSEASDDEDRSENDSEEENKHT